MAAAAAAAHTMHVSNSLAKDKLRHSAKRGEEKSALNEGEGVGGSSLISMQIKLTVRLVVLPRRSNYRNSERIEKGFVSSHTHSASLAKNNIDTANTLAIVSSGGWRRRRRRDELPVVYCCLSSSAA